MGNPLEFQLNFRLPDCYYDLARLEKSTEKPNIITKLYDIRVYTSCVRSCSLLFNLWYFSFLLFSRDEVWLLFNAVLVHLFSLFYDVIHEFDMFLHWLWTEKLKDKLQIGVLLIDTLCYSRILLAAGFPVINGSMKPLFRAASWFLLSRAWLTTIDGLYCPRAAFISKISHFRVVGHGGCQWKLGCHDYYGLLCSSRW